ALCWNRSPVRLEPGPDGSRSPHDWRCDTARIVRISLDHSSRGDGNWSICPEADNLSSSKDFIKTGPWPRSIAAWTSCALPKQPLRLYQLPICLKDRPHKNFGADGIPLAQLKETSRVPPRSLQNKRGNGTI